MYEFKIDMSGENMNGRKYDPKGVDEAVKKYAEKPDKFCTIEHTEGQAGVINLDKVSHKINTIESENGVITGTLQTLSTPQGQILAELLKTGEMRLVTEGVGNLDENGVVQDFQLMNMFFTVTPAVPSELVKINNED